MTLIVYSGGLRSGILDMADGEPFYGFAYDGAYLARGDAFPLSLSLPLREERFSGAESLPYFEGLLPEGEVRASIARQLGISPNSPAGLLRALGKDCAGDVTVLEEDDPYQPPAEDSYAPLPEGLAAIARNPHGEIAHLRADNRLSLAGGQEKIGLYHDGREPMDAGWHVPLEGSPSTHIIKPQVLDAYPNLACNEYLCMKAAKLAGLAVAEVEILALERPMLVVERFDRAPTGRESRDGLQVFRRLRQEDFCQALGFPSSRKYEMDGGPGVRDACGLLRAHSSSAIRDRDELLRLLLFNFAIGNCDAHAKNLSIAIGSLGAVRLAPAYDLVSTTVYDRSYGSSLSRSLGMRIGEHANIDRVTRGDVKLLAGQAGVSPAYLQRIAEGVAGTLPACLDEAGRILREQAPLDTGDLLRRITEGAKARLEILAG